MQTIKFEVELDVDRQPTAEEKAQILDHLYDAIFNAESNGKLVPLHSDLHTLFAETTLRGDGASV